MISKNILDNIQIYVDAAEAKQGFMNTNLLYAPACIAKEAGEALRDATGMIDHGYTMERMAELRKNVYQTIAVAVRYLEIRE